MPAPVVLAHRHAAYRGAIAAALRDAGALVIETADLDAAASAARRHAPCTLLFDLSLLRDGDRLGDLIATLPGIEVVCLGADDDAAARAVLALGASRCLPSAASDADYLSLLVA